MAAWALGFGQALGIDDRHLALVDSCMSTQCHRRLHTLVASDCMTGAVEARTKSLPVLQTASKRRWKGNDE